MFKNNTKITDKSWRRKPLFMEPEPRPILNIVIILLALALLTVLIGWLDIPPFDFLFKDN
jgi:hypothetical protein